MKPVTRENGSSRDPYPPTTVSLLTKPRLDFKSARTTRIGHLTVPTTFGQERARAGWRGTARRPGRERAARRPDVERTREDAERQQFRDAAAVGRDAGDRRIVLDRLVVVADQGAPVAS